MAKKKRSRPTPIQSPAATKSWNLSPRTETLAATAWYVLITGCLTWPLLFKMGSSVYGPYDHATTDLFAAIYQNFWWLAKAVFGLHTSPMYSPLLAAPFGTAMTFVNFTGFAELPITALFGAVFTRNLNIVLNLVLAALGMFLLVRYITKNAAAGFVAGIIFAFCPNMLVRSYTTFDSTQVQWIPFYTLYILKFIETKGWKDALLAGMFLSFHILFSFPYYLVYLPIQTIVMITALAVWHINTNKTGIGDLFRAVTSREALGAWMKLGAALAIAIVVFAAYYTVIIGGGGRMETAGRTTQQLEELAQVPSDYLVPHPDMALLKGNVKAAYWDRHRPGKDPNSFVAYIGYLALLLAAAGIWRGRGAEKWIFIAGAAVAFWATLGPSLFGLPTPSGLIHSLYGSFARRILIYKVFVQFGIAGLAGLGFASLSSRLESTRQALQVSLGLGLLMVIEYSLVPPALSVDLTEPPTVYRHLKNLPDDTIVAEFPFQRDNTNLYQGYLFYQSYHEKPLFNPHLGMTGVPDHIKPFYEQMKVPIEACEYANLAAMRFLGVTHLVYHWRIGTDTVFFRSLAAPALLNKQVNGLSIMFSETGDPAGSLFDGPYDYFYADLYEITAEPCPVAITFDYASPYEHSSAVIPPEQDQMIGLGWEYSVGWMSTLLDSTRSFSYPIPNGVMVERLMHQNGTITVTNLSDEPVDFTLSCSVMADNAGRVIEARWMGDERIGTITLEGSEKRFTLEPIRLDGGSQGTVVFSSDSGPYQYPIGTTTLNAHAVVRDVRARLLTD